MELFSVKIPNKFQPNHLLIHLQHLGSTICGCSLLWGFSHVENHMRVYPCQYSIDLGVVVRRWLTTANPVMMGSRQLPSENHDCFKCDSWMKSLYVFVLVKPCFWPCVFGCLTYIEAGTHPLVQYIYMFTNDAPECQAPHTNRDNSHGSMAVAQLGWFDHMQDTCQNLI